MNATGSKTENAIGAGSRCWLALGVRVATVSLGLAAVGWGSFAAPSAWRQASTAPLATKIVAGERFKPGILERSIERAKPDLPDGICQPVTLRTLAVVRLRLAEEAITAGDRRSIDQTQSDGEAALRLSLSCTPTDPFLWFALFWLQNSRRGLQEDNFRALRMSYRVGPNEGWVSLRRNRIAIAVYPGLPSDLKQAATDEFVQLVKSDLITDAADILAGPGRPVSSMLLARLQGIEEKKLRFLAMLLAAKGFDDAIPGLETSSRLPWQH
jgi:hypothetical protein